MRVFKIPGKVQAKQRPRFNVKNGRVYTPEQTLNYESYVKWCYSDYAKQEGWEKPLENAISAEIEVFMPIPKSDQKEERSEIKR
nr:RusA family crossover junction endodeoxyribonuclease [Turicibacter sanguinis]